MCGITGPCEKESCTWKEHHRATTEARAVLSWPLLERRGYLLEVEKRRGKAAVERLKQDMMRLFMKRVE